MVWQVVAVAGGVLFAASELLGESEQDHNEVVEETYEELRAEVPRDATVYADHLSHRDIPNPEGEVDGLTHVPDLVVKSGVASNLIIPLTQTTSSSTANTRSPWTSSRSSFASCIVSRR